MTPTKIHLTFCTDASGDVLIDKASPEPFVGSAEFVLRHEADADARIVEVARKLIAAHPRDLGRAMMSDGHSGWHRKQNLYPSPAIEAGKPVYQIVHYGHGMWGVHKCRSLERMPNGEIGLLYEWLWPATQKCRTRAEAIEWMRADAEGRRPNFKRVSMFDRHDVEDFDQYGRPFIPPSPSEKGVG